LLNIIANSGKLYRTVSRNFRVIPAWDAMLSAKTLIFHEHDDGMKPALLVVPRCDGVEFSNNNTRPCQ